MNQTQNSLKQVKILVQQELRQLSLLYPYNLKKFYDPKLLHTLNIFAFLQDNGSFDLDFYKKFLKLLVGIELLAMGVGHHSYNTDDFMKLAEDISVSPGHRFTSKEYKNRREKNYIIDLLYGDIFYSRAVIHLLDYGDFYIFNSILDSLKTVHHNRLLLHQKLIDMVNIIRNDSKILDFETRIEGLIEENNSLVIGVNSLLKTSFFIGWGLFGNPEEFVFPYQLINYFIMTKAFRDLSDFFLNLPGEFYFLRKLKYLQTRQNSLREELNKAIASVKPEWLRKNFELLARSYS